ncbi:S53 family peptidase [Ideonella dechloratans]|uniref:S53 family peptidase n=1 Tax=Ideonella dechloratans TaxID=36863 RepID=UPI0035AF5D3F
MPRPLLRSSLRLLPAPWLSALLLGALSACGGGGDGARTAATASAGSLATVQARPTYHLAPVLLGAPADTDMTRPSASARLAPHTTQVPQALAGLSSRGLTVQALQAALADGGAGARARMAGATASAEGAAVQPMAAGSTVTTYTPAQIRAAYNLPALPDLSGSLTATEAAQLGAGQTVYIVNAYHDPNIAAELAAFAGSFGLPGCSVAAIDPAASLPLASAASDGCTLSVVYATSGGGMTADAPAYNAGWATEIALDVQWVHATAPMARIVLIEVPDSGIASIANAVALANAMGPGVVSLSLGASEGSWVSSVDTVFYGTGMSYVAATGDNGAAVEWPSVSPGVLAVGGTTLSFKGSGARSETVWSGTGGGVSKYLARPAYQTKSVPGLGTPARRSVADVAFNANPASGQYVAVMSQDGRSTSWVSAGGTSLATPQWAALLAVANALRVQSSLGMIGAPHNAFYASVASVAKLYAADFLDVNSGKDGSCALCSAKAGYDNPSGLGTPQGVSLLSTLTGVTVPAIAPSVTSGAVNGQAGVALSFSVSVSAANALRYSLDGAPAGMAVNTAGVVSWAKPVTGSYSVTVTATDTRTGQTAQGVYAITIVTPDPPSVTAATASAVAGKAFSQAMSYTAPNAVTWTLTKPPSGMVISTAGVVSWPKPVKGSYSVTVTARDSKTGKTGSAVLSLTVNAS